MSKSTIFRGCVEFRGTPCSVPAQYSSASAGSVSGSDAERQRRRRCRWRHRVMDVGLRPALPWSDSEMPSGANRSSCAGGYSNHIAALQITTSIDNGRDLSGQGRGWGQSDDTSCEASVGSRHAVKQNSTVTALIPGLDDRHIKSRQIMPRHQISAVKLPLSRQHGSAHLGRPCGARLGGVAADASRGCRLVVLSSRAEEAPQSLQT